MTAHASRLPTGLAPLIAEAKHRMRRRRSLVVLLTAFAGLAIGLTLIFRSSGPGPGVPRPLTSSLRAGELRVSVPRGFRTYPVRGGFYRTGGPLIGHALANFTIPGYVSTYGVFATQWTEPSGSGPPANGVALEVELDVALGPAPTTNLHLPLTLRQPWSQVRLDNGRLGYRWGYLRFHKELYELMYWSGPNAPATDRAAILRALKSIRPAH